MSAAADAARETRHAAAGGKRLTARVSGDAHDMLVLLAQHHGMDQRRVVNSLLLAAGHTLLRTDDFQLQHVMRQHRMSRPEAELFRACVAQRVAPTPTGTPP